jgi:hypothetical protein
MEFILNTEIIIHTHDKLDSLCSSKCKFLGNEDNCILLGNEDNCILLDKYIKPINIDWIEGSEENFETNHIRICKENIPTSIKAYIK